MSQQRVVNADKLGIAKIHSWSSVRKSPCIGPRNHEGRQKSNEKISLIWPGLKYARGKHLILRFKGAWNTFVHVRGCASGLDWGSHLLAARCGFFDSISHSISPAWKALTISERSPGSSCARRPPLAKMRETSFPCLEVEIGERATLNEFAAFNPRWNCHTS